MSEGYEAKQPAVMSVGERVQAQQGESEPTMLWEHICSLYDGTDAFWPKVVVCPTIKFPHVKQEWS